MNGQWHCGQHDDCFALNSFGRCTALVDTQFRGPCPFYKTQEQYRKEEAERIKRGAIYERI